MGKGTCNVQLHWPFTFHVAFLSKHHYAALNDKGHFRFPECVVRRAFGTNMFSVMLFKSNPIILGFYKSHTTPAPVLKSASPSRGVESNCRTPHCMGEAEVRFVQNGTSSLSASNHRRDSRVDTALRIRNQTSSQAGCLSFHNRGHISPWWQARLKDSSWRTNHC